MTINMSYNPKLSLNKNSKNLLSNSCTFPTYKKRLVIEQQTQTNNPKFFTFCTKDP